MPGQTDPTGILRSVPGVGPILAVQILGRLGDPARFTSLAAVRSYSGLVPDLDSSGQSSRHGGPTKAGDACLREALLRPRRSVQDRRRWFTHRVTRRPVRCVAESSGEPPSVRYLSDAGWPCRSRVGRFRLSQRR